MAKELRANLSLPVAVRSDLNDDGSKGSSIIEGYAAVYNERTVIWGIFEEEIAPGFFDRAISEKHDCRSLFNHDPNYPLGRTKSGTLTLRSDSKGLWTETRTADTPIACSIVESIRRGDVDGMSFAFTLKRQEWIFAEEGSGQMDLRRCLEIERLYDTGPVTYPAYEQTSIKVREEARKMHGEARSRWLERNRKIIVASAGIPEADKELWTMLRANAPLCECRGATEEDWQEIDDLGKPETDEANTDGKETKSEGTGEEAAEEAGEKTAEEEGAADESTDNGEVPVEPAPARVGRDPRTVLRDIAIARESLSD